MAHGNIEQRFESSTCPHADANETLIVHLNKKNVQKMCNNYKWYIQVTVAHPQKSFNLNYSAAIHPKRLFQEGDRDKLNK